ncbi:MAG: EamA family transporter [Candidatus Eremiobacteraeota bacterium]|nr:EamA family transporter [Candidatus Eremiobacteraeota bacterium]
MERTIEASGPGIGIAPEDRRMRSRLDPRLIVALGAVWLFWGSTIAGMRFAVETIPPYAMASARFLLAGAILYGICAVRGNGRVTRDDIVRAAITGGSLLLFGNGLIAWTVQYLPVGINSLLISISPVFMAIIAFLWGGERPTRFAVVGMLLGFGGLALLLQPKATSGIALWPAIVTLLASVAWSFGSVYQRRTGKNGSLILATALQMLFGGAFLGIEAGLFGQWQSLDVHAISAVSLAGVAWLMIFGSLLGYSAYLYTMEYASTALASTYAYVNPIVAVVLGMLLFHERFTPAEALASAIILVGVALMMVPARRVRTARA